jgi:hypothetical protein
METVVLENIRAFNSKKFDGAWDVLEKWLNFNVDADYFAPIWATDDNWEHLYTFQLFVREARKDE